MGCSAFNCDERAIATRATREVDERRISFRLAPHIYKPIAIRIWSEGSAAQMRVVRLSGAGGYEPGDIESDTTIKVSPEDWKRFHDCITKAQFWQMPTKQPAEELGFDGSQWMLEARDAGNYHVVDRWTPREGAYADCCRFLITLAKLQISKDEIY